MRSLAYSFSAGGLLFPYYIGIASALQDLGALTPGSTPLAGASAGSLIAACVHSGMSGDATMRACLALVATLRDGGVYRRLGDAVGDTLREHLPEDAHERCSGVTHVAVTNAVPCALPGSSLLVFLLFLRAHAAGLRRAVRVALVAQ